MTSFDVGQECISTDCAEKDTDTLVFCGGGMRAFACHTALVLALDAKSKRQHIKNIYGTSTGALAGLYLACFASGWDMLCDYLFSTPLVYTQFELLSLIAGRMTTYEKKLTETIDRLLTEAYDYADITLAELYDVSGGIRLCCVATNVTSVMSHLHRCGDDELHSMVDHEQQQEPKREIIVFTPETHGDMCVRDAVLASMAIPGLVSPVRYKEEWYVDGSSLYNFPLPEAAGKSTIAVNVVMTMTPVVHDLAFPQMNLVLGHSYLMSTIANLYIWEKRKQDRNVMEEDEQANTTFTFDPPQIPSSQTHLELRIDAVDAAFATFIRHFQQ